MTTPSDPQHEHPSTYVVQDRSDQDELTRVTLQDQALTASMGGPLPEQTHPERWRRVLDVGCGSGAWLLETAKLYPDIRQLVGVDISHGIIEYAREQAAAQDLEGRVEFQVMDAMRSLEFPAETFDLVNLRLGASFIRTWDWPGLLKEFQRVTRPGGTVRVVDTDLIGESNGPAVNELAELFLQAFYQAGHLFTQEHMGLLNTLPTLLVRSGLQQVQVRSHLLEYHPGGPGWQYFYDDIRHLTRLIRPFLQKWTRLPDDYDTLIARVLNDMHQPDFMAKWTICTIWGTKSLR